MGWNEKRKERRTGYVGDALPLLFVYLLNHVDISSFSVSIVNIEVAPDTVNFTAPRQHCWGLKWNAGARWKRYVCDLTKRQERSECLLTRDVYLPGTREPHKRYVFDETKFENHAMSVFALRISRWTWKRENKSTKLKCVFISFHYCRLQYNSLLEFTRDTLLCVLSN